MPNFAVALPAEVCKELGGRVRARRLQCNLTTQELAQRVGVSDRTLRNLEHTGRCTLETFVRVLESLNALPDLEPVLQGTITSIGHMRQLAAVKQRLRASSPRPPKPSTKLTPTPTPTPTPTAVAYGLSGGVAMAGGDPGCP